ncbi:MAG: gamma-glutamyltransferase [Thermoanaerobaculia bacterium]|nr:gamma-glutamyltransferase [Thermoanaerobaculia bacterium]
MKRPAAATTLFALLLAAPGPGWGDRKKVNLSPARWPSGDLEKYAELTHDSIRPQEQAAGREGMVVGTTGALAVRSGLEALRQGGSAADAAIATALVQVTLAAGCWVSFAGRWSMIYYDASTGEVHSLNANYNTVLGEDDPLSIPSAPEPSGRTALVPGFLAGVEATHQRFGKLKFKKLFKPAIYFARQGFEVYPLLASLIQFRGDVLTRLPAARAIFTKPDGSLYQVGDRFRQLELAKTLGRVSKQGADYAYRGPWARRFVDAVAAQGGKMTLEDLERYEVIWAPPERGSFYGDRVWGPAPPALGGERAVASFRGIQSRGLPARGHYAESGDLLHEMMTITRRVRGIPAAASRGFGGHSDGVIAVDAEGNVATVVHTINTDAWGSTGIFVDGVSIPDSAWFQQQRIADTGPGNRLPEPSNPLIVTRKGEPVLASSAIGAGLFEVTIQAVANALAWGMSPIEARDAPAYHGVDSLTDGQPQFVRRGDFDDQVIDRVRELGIPVRLFSDGDGAAGTWIGVTIDPDTGEILGVAGRRLNGWAEGL